MGSDKGLIHIYTGDGKGKTTAGLGLCFRAAGAGLKVVLARFLKLNRSAELNAIARMPEITVIENDEIFGFSNKWIDDEEKKASARRYYDNMLKTALNTAVAEYADVLMLDEIMAAARLGLVDVDVLVDFLANKPDTLEVIMTGREPLQEIAEQADYISEIKKVKHPFDEGIPARRGIEF